LAILPNISNFTLNSWTRNPKKPIKSSKDSKF